MAQDCTLPFEILDNIFTFLRDDALSLHACACVSETFLAIVERHLYNHVVLHNSTHPSDGYFSTTAPQLSKILAMSPHITKYVKSAEVSVTSPSVLKWFMTRSLDDEGMAPALSKLSYLESISLTGSQNGHINWDSLHSRLQTSLLRTFGSQIITEIILIRVNQFPLSAFQNCTALKKLSLIHCTFYDNGSRQDGKARPHVDSLTIQLSFMEYPTVLAWLLGANASLDITGLQILQIMTTSSNCTYLSHVLSMCAESLRVLDLKTEQVNTGYDAYTGHVVNPVGPERQLDLLNMQYLRLLSVAGLVYSVEDFWVGSTGEETREIAIYSAPFAWLAQIFGTAPPSLTHIIIRLSFNINMISLAKVDWREMVQALLSVASLKHVSILVSFLNTNTNLSIDDLVDFLQNQEHLAKLTQKGLLSVSKVPEAERANHRTRL